MTLTRLSTALFALILSLPFCVYAQTQAQAPSLSHTVDAPFAFATAETAKNGAAFMVIRNTSQQDDHLKSATGDIAQKIELHKVEIDQDDIMKMMVVENAPLPAGGSIVMDPQGSHVMLLGLKKPLAVGERFPLTLTFEKAGAQEIMVEVVAPGTTPESAPHHDHAH